MAQNNNNQKVNEAPEGSFLFKINQWHREKLGTDFKIPIFYSQELDVERLYNLVMDYGGSLNVNNKRLWSNIGKVMGPRDRKASSLAFQIKRLFCTYLLPYEKAMSPCTALFEVPMVYSSRKRSKIDDEDSDIIMLEDDEIQYQKKNRPKRSTNCLQNLEYRIEDLGMEIVGQDIMLYDDAKQRYDRVTITGFDPDTELHGVNCVGDELSEFVDLRYRVWQPIFNGLGPLENNDNKDNHKLGLHNINESESTAIEQLAKLKEGPVGQLYLPWGVNGVDQYVSGNPSNKSINTNEGSFERLQKAREKIQELENEVAANRLGIQDAFQITSFDEQQLEKQIFEYKKRLTSARHQRDYLIRTQNEIKNCLEKIKAMSN